MWYIYVMWHFKIKIQSNTMEHTAPRFLFRFKIIHFCLFYSRTASLDLEPYLINKQNKYTRGWYNCLLCDITVSGGWYNRSCVIRSAFCGVDSYIYYICDITWKLIQKCYIKIWQVEIIIWQVMAEICHHTFENRYLCIYIIKYVRTKFKNVFIKIKILQIEIFEHEWPYFTLLLYHIYISLLSMCLYIHFFSVRWLIIYLHFSLKTYSRIRMDM